jgi:phosphoribosylformylglycinamidine synthase
VETAWAFERAGASTEYLHVNRLIEKPSLEDRCEILCIPGGFSYGDDIGAGKILASQFSSHLCEAVDRFRDAGKLVLGICNGFQVLIKTGFLVPPDEQGLPVTLTWNDNGRYTCTWVRLEPGESQCVFLRDVEDLYLPVAHAEGRFVARDDAVLERLRSDGNVALLYAEVNRNGSAPANGNPNGSVDDIAGLCDSSGCVFGLMPHPERFIDPTQHPRWTRERPAGTPDGLRIFENAVGWFAA